MRSFALRTGREARKSIPSAYPGDLALLKVQGLPKGGFIPDLEGDVRDGSAFYAVGADLARQEVRVFDPGKLIARPAKGADLGRLHVRARMQPGVSGGALVNERGELVGIAVGGGDGRFEAMPLEAVRSLLAMSKDARSGRGDAPAGQGPVGLRGQDGRHQAACGEPIRPRRALESLRGGEEPRPVA